MKIGRLFLVILALTTATLSAAPRKGGSVAHPRPGRATSAAAPDYWFYCYDEPDVTYLCDGAACDCRAACAEYCGGPCDWDSTCIN